MHAASFSRGLARDSWTAKFIAGKPAAKRAMVDARAL
jgi:hypothetical protein